MFPDIDEIIVGSRPLVEIGADGSERSLGFQYLRCLRPEVAAPSRPQNQAGSNVSYAAGSSDLDDMGQPPVLGWCQD